MCGCILFVYFFFFSSRRRHTRFDCDWSSDVCSSDLILLPDRDPGGFEDRAVALLALAQPAEHRQARQGIRKPPADRLEEDLLAPRPDARVRALAESEHVREIALGVQRHDDPRLDAEELPLLGRQRML